MKNPEEMMTRGKGNFINCTDYDDAIEAIKQAQIEAYNEALEDAAENAKHIGGGYCVDQEYEPHIPLGVDKQSILKLKKSVSSTD